MRTWGKQGPTGQFTATYETLRGALNDSQSPYYWKSFEIAGGPSDRVYPASELGVGHQHVDLARLAEFASSTMDTFRQVAIGGSAALLGRRALTR